MKLLIFIFLIFVTTCNGQRKKTNQIIDKQAVSSQFQLSNSTYVILDYKSDWYWIFKNAKPTTLSKNELAEIENIIEKAVKENNEKQQVHLEKHNKEYPDNNWKETGFELKTKGFNRQYVR